jgi:hypothetical protein
VAITLTALSYLQAKKSGAPRAGIDYFHIFGYLFLNPEK